MPSQPLSETISSDNADNPSVLDRVREPTESSIHPLDPSAAPKDTLHRKPTVFTTTKSILRGIEESPNTYPLLKPVGRCLRAILDKYKVWFPSSHIQSVKLTTALANGGE